MSNSKDAIDLMNELLNMPEYQLALALEELHFSISIFEGNYYDLQQLIGFLTTNPRADDLLQITDRDKLKTSLVTVIRLLHNYVAAAFSLMDHTRRLGRQIFDDRVFPDYEPRKQSTFSHDPLARFMLDLRRYCQHYKAPNLRIEVRPESDTSPEEKCVILHMKDLRSFQDWSSEAKKYLDAAGEQVDILEAATTYRQKVLSFYGWFESRIREIHSEEFTRYHHKEIEYILARLDMEIQIISSSRKQGFASRPEDAFAVALNSLEIEELRTVPISSDGRAMHAIQLLERKLPMPTDIKERIIDLYREEGTSSYPSPDTRTVE